MGTGNVVGLFEKGKRGKAGEKRSVGVENTAGVAGMFAGGSRGSQAAPTEVRDERARALGEKVLRHRDRCALTQEEYAERAGIGRTRLSQIEGGKVWPSRRIRAKLASFMGVSPESLWQDEDSRDTIPAEEDHQNTRQTADREAS